MTYRRGDLVKVVVQGDFGKPRPALVVQADWLVEPQSQIVCLLTSDLKPASLYRVRVAPTAANGLRETSDIQIDKMASVTPERIGGRIGSLEAAQMVEIDRVLASVLGLADG